MSSIGTICVNDAQFALEYVLLNVEGVRDLARACKVGHWMQRSMCRVMSRQGVSLKIVNNSGFTLGEVLVAIAVFGILSAIAIPSFLSVQPALRLNGGAREVLGKLRWARSQAVMQNATFVVDFPDNHTLRIFNDANLNGSWDSGESTQTFDIQTDYSGVTVASGANPQFTARGTVNGATDITVSNENGTKTVRVTSSGNVKIL